MIQRIQSVYLLLATILLLVLYMFPVATFQSSQGLYLLFTCHILNPETGSQLISMVPLAVLPLLSAILSLIIIFRFKNRSNQMQLSKLVMLIQGITLVVEGIYFVRIGKMLGINGKPAFMAFTPLLVLILLVLAYRGIKKDDLLVKSADRIR
jgi:hypothetical protein